jgi:hypothetical protein
MIYVLAANVAHSLSRARPQQVPNGYLHCPSLRTHACCCIQQQPGQAMLLGLHCSAVPGPHLCRAAVDPAQVVHHQGEAQQDQLKGEVGRGRQREPAAAAAAAAAADRVRTRKGAQHWQDKSHAAAFRVMHGVAELPHGIMIQSEWSLQCIHCSS